MARKPKTQLHPDVAAALPVAIAAIGGTPAPARRGRKAQADAPLPEPPASGRGDAGPGSAGTDADSTPAKAPRRPKRPAAAAATPAPEGPALKRRGPKRRASQPDEAPERVEAEAPGHEAGPQLADAASADPVPMGTASAVPGGDTQPPLPGLDAQPAAHWDRATNSVRFNWPAIERTAATGGPNQGMAKLLVAARAEGANSRWPL